MLTGWQMRSDGLQEMKVSESEAAKSLAMQMWLCRRQEKEHLNSIPAREKRRPGHGDQILKGRYQAGRQTWKRSGKHS